MTNQKLPRLKYSEIYADAILRPKNEIQDMRMEILEHYESLREDLKTLEIYLHALGDVGLVKGRE